MVTVTVVFFTAVLAVVPFFGALAVFTAIHLFGIILLAAIGFAFMAFHGAFAAFATIGFFRCNAFALILAAAVEFVIRFRGRLETHVVITNFRDLLLDFGCVRGAAFVRYGQLLGIGIPAGIFGAGLFGGFFDLVFAHAAVAGHLKGFSLALRRGGGSNSERKECERKYFKRFHLEKFKNGKLF